MEKLILLFRAKSYKEIVGSINANYFKSGCSIIKNVLNVCILSLLFTNTTYGQPIFKEIDRLGQKCSKGDVESCEKLTAIAKNNKDSDVCAAAVSKITDQSVLSDIAKHSLDYGVRQTAVHKITGQSVFVDIAKNSNDYIIRETATNKINDQSVLSDIAKNDKQWLVCSAAVKKITDQGILAEIAINVEDGSVINAAVVNITDKNALVDVANKMKNLAYSVYVLFNELEAENRYLQLINLKNQNISKDENISSLAALKTILCDIILKKYFYYGKRGDQTQLAVEIGITHEGIININEICKDLLSPVSRDDLFKISKTSDVYFLRETAKRMLEK